jgi:hypothetical protein
MLRHIALGCANLFGEFTDCNFLVAECAQNTPAQGMSHGFERIGGQHGVIGGY